MAEIDRPIMFINSRCYHCEKFVQVQFGGVHVCNPVNKVRFWCENCGKEVVCESRPLHMEKCPRDNRVRLQIADEEEEEEAHTEPEDGLTDGEVERIQELLMDQQYEGDEDDIESCAVAQNSRRVRRVMKSNLSKEDIDDYDQIMENLEKIEDKSNNGRFKRLRKTFSSNRYPELPMVRVSDTEELIRRLEEEESHAMVQKPERKRPPFIRSVRTVAFADSLVNICSFRIRQCILSKKLSDRSIIKCAWMSDEYGPAIGRAIASCRNYITENMVKFISMEAFWKCKERDLLIGMLNVGVVECTVKPKNFANGFNADLVKLLKATLERGYEDISQSIAFNGLDLSEPESLVRFITNCIKFDNFDCTYDYALDLAKKADWNRLMCTSTLAECDTFVREIVTDIIMSFMREFSQAPVSKKIETIETPEYECDIQYEMAVEMGLI